MKGLHLAGNTAIGKRLHIPAEEGCLMDTMLYTNDLQLSRFAEYLLKHSTERQGLLVHLCQAFPTS